MYVCACVFLDYTFSVDLAKLPHIYVAENVMCNFYGSDKDEDELTI